MCINSNVSNVIKESGDIEVHGHNIFFSEKIGRIFGWEDDNVSIHSLSKPYEAGKNNDYRAISIYPKTRVGSIGDAFTCREFTNNKLTEYVLYGSHNSKRVMTVSNSDGNGKTFKSKDWVYLGTHITVPANSIGIIFARRGWYTGKPYGMLISNSNTDLRSSYIVGSSHSNKSKETLGQIEEYLYTSLALTVIVNPGTYYLWSCLDPERQESTDNFITSEGMLAVIMTN